MASVISFSEFCKGKGAEEILSHPALQNDLQRLEAEFNSLPKKEREELKTLLHSVLNCLDEHLKILAKQQRQSLEAIQHTQRSSAACVAYLKTPNGER